MVGAEVDKSIGKELGFRAIEIQQLQESLCKTREFVVEEQDKERRRNNIVLYRVPESDAATAADRVSEDKKFCEQLLNGLDCALTVVQVLLEYHHYNIVRQKYFSVTTLKELFAGLYLSNFHKGG